VVTASIAFFLLARVTTIRGLYIAATFLAISKYNTISNLLSLPLHFTSPPHSHHLLSSLFPAAKYLVLLHILFRITIYCNHLMASSTSHSFLTTLPSTASATVVTGLNGLASFEASSSQRGSVLGRHRAWGQVGRTIGPLVFCTLYWWAGREVAYAVGAAGMVGVVGLVFGGLAVPKGTEIKKAVKTS